MNKGSQVSVPDRIIFPNRRDPYEWENGIVVDTGKNKHGEKLVKVKVWRHFQKTTYEKWFKVSMVQKPSFHHFVGEREIFQEWLHTQGIYPAVIGLNDVSMIDFSR